MCLSQSSVGDGKIVEGFMEKGKGYPDFATRQFLHFLFKNTPFQQERDGNLLTSDVFEKVPDAWEPVLWSSDVFNCPQPPSRAELYGLFDFDPHGIDIYLCYRHGSMVNQKKLIVLEQRPSILGLSFSRMDWTAL